MTCTVLLEVRVKKEHVASMAEGFKGLFPDTRWFEGCIGLYATQNMDDPQNFVVVETWESRQDYEKYFAWRVGRGDIDNLKSIIEGDINLRYFERLRA
jgi:quinol monooxygenase YgiN